MRWIQSIIAWLSSFIRIRRTFLISFHRGIRARSRRQLTPFILASLFLVVFYVCINGSETEETGDVGISITWEKPPWGYESETGKDQDVMNSSSHQNREWIDTLRQRFNTNDTAKERPAGATDKQNITRYGELPECPSDPPNLAGSIKVNNTIPRYEELYRKGIVLDKGGHWKPHNCRPRHRVAIVIPYRAREKHLLVLLHNLHPFLQKQQLDYTIFVVEQAGSDVFNKGMLMNAGFAEAMRSHDFQCVAFHDVDLLPGNGKILYSCPKDKPRHMSATVDRLRHRGPENYWATLVGGVLMMTPHQFVTVNGYSNRFIGWGGEDDNMYYRLSKTVGFSRYPGSIAKYHMIKHARDKGNPINRRRKHLLEVTSEGRSWETDGLTTLNYVVLENEKRRLFTWLYIGLLRSDGPADISEPQAWWQQWFGSWLK